MCFGGTSSILVNSSSLAENVSYANFKRKNYDKNKKKIHMNIKLQLECIRTPQKLEVILDPLEVYTHYHAPHVEPIVLFNVNKISIKVIRLLYGHDN